MEEKHLTNKENISIFEKVKSFFRRLFHIEKTDVDNNTQIKQEEKPGFIDEFKRKQEIMNLQQQYEAGVIAEADMKEEDKQKLIELYKEQINEIHNNIKTYKNLLQQYKEQILEIKNKIPIKNSV